MSQNIFPFDFKSNKCFKNLLKAEIPDEVADILALGKKLGVPLNVNQIPINS